MTKTKRAKPERSNQVGSGVPSEMFTLEPRWWGQAIGGGDLDQVVGWEIVDHACEVCGKRRGCHIVTGDPAVEEGAIFLCTRCLVDDHKAVTWRFQQGMFQARWRARQAAEHEAAVEANLGRRVEA